MKEVGAEAALHEADHHQVRELARENAVQCVRSIGPPLAQVHAVATLRVETEAMVEIGGDFET